MSEPVEADRATPAASPASWPVLEWRRSILLFIGIAVLLAGSYLTLDALRDTRRADRAHRFALAVEQLSKPDAASRLTGMFLLADLAAASEDDEPRVADILSAYVREHAPIRGPNPMEPERLRVPVDIQAALTALGRRRSPFVAGRSRRIDLMRTDLRYADLAGASLDGVLLSEARLDGANLAGAHLDGAVLRGAHLERASLAGASLVGAYLGQARLEGASLRGATLDDAYLTGARLDGADLLDTDLRGAFGVTWEQVGRARRGKDTRFPASVTPPEPERGPAVR